MAPLILPILYNEGKNRKWKIWVSGVNIYRTDGLANKDFTKAPSCKEVTAKAHTNAEEQAIKEAKAMWVKKLNDDYKPLSTDVDGMKLYDQVMKNKLQQGGNNQGAMSETGKGSLKNVVSTITITKKVGAMLAKKYSDEKKKLVWTPSNKESLIDSFIKKNVSREQAIEKFNKTYFDASTGCIVQAKLDGVRCISFLQGEDVVTLTRQNKQFVHLLQQKEHIKLFLENHRDVVIDGEWYIHNCVVDGKKLESSLRFNFISSCCRSSMTNANKNEGIIQYHVFDIVDEKMPQKNRYILLNRMFQEYNKKVENPFLKFVSVHIAKNEEEVVKYEKKFIEKGYEGLMLKCAISPYEQGKRSIHLLKYKEFEDAEFKIVGANEGTSTSKGAVIFICSTKSGDEFTCQMNLDIEMQRQMYKERDKYIGKMLTVKYQDLDENTGIPRFPKGIGIRDYE